MLNPPSPPAAADLTVDHLEPSVLEEQTHTGRQEAVRNASVQSLGDIFCLHDATVRYKGKSHLCGTGESCSFVRVTVTKALCLFPATGNESLCHGICHRLSVTQKVHLISLNYIQISFTCIFSLCVKTRGVMQEKMQREKQWENKVFREVRCPFHGHLNFFYLPKHLLIICLQIHYSIFQFTSRMVHNVL